MTQRLARAFALTSALFLVLAAVCIWASATTRGTQLSPDQRERWSTYAAAVARGERLPSQQVTGSLFTYAFARDETLGAVADLYGGLALGAGFLGIAQLAMLYQDMRRRGAARPEMKHDGGPAGAA
jgi:hypothetical protein